MQEFELNGRTIKLRINRRAKRIILKLEAGQVVVVTPSKRDIPKAVAFAKARQDWIEQNAPIVDSGKIGEWTVLYVDAGPAARFDYENKLVTLSKSKTITTWRKHLAQEALDILLPIAAQLNDREASSRLMSSVKIHNFKAKWGSCSSSGVIKFAPVVAFLPPDLREYIIAHELAHLTHLNHSPDFWRQVAAITEVDIKSSKLRLKNFTPTPTLDY